MFVNRLTSTTLGWGLNIHTGLAYNIKFICWHLVPSTGDPGNSTGSFSQEGFSTTAGGKSKQVSFTFKPSMNLKPGQYVLMIGAENEAVTYLRAIKVNLNWYIVLRSNFISYNCFVV